MPDTRLDLVVGVSACAAAVHLLDDGPGLGEQLPPSCRTRQAASGTTAGRGARETLILAITKVIADRQHGSPSGTRHPEVRAAVVITGTGNNQKGHPAADMAPVPDMLGRPVRELAGELTPGLRRSMRRGPARTRCSVHLRPVEHATNHRRRIGARECCRLGGLALPGTEGNLADGLTGMMGPGELALVG